MAILKGNVLRPKGAKGESLGQRPRYNNQEISQALKGRNTPVAAFLLTKHSHFSTPNKTVSRVE
jgi:hypothetical protein